MRLWTLVAKRLIFLCIPRSVVRLKNVNKLLPFDASCLQSFEIFSDMVIDAKDASRLNVVFKINDEQSEVDLENRILMYEGASLERKDELWKMTCFEMFLNPVGQKQYYEFNFSLEGAWNCYHFAGYRFPQPPQANNEFEIEKILWKSKQLEVSIHNKTAFQKFNIGLTAVIKNKKNQTTYFALKHEGGKPDFHLASGFALQRG